MYVTLLKWSKGNFGILEIFGGEEKMFENVGRKTLYVLKSLPCISLTSGVLLFSKYFGLK